MEINHPAATMLSEIVKMQQLEFGDNTNYTLSFAGELLRNAEDLIKMGIHPADIVNGYKLGFKHAEEQLSKYNYIKLNDVRNKNEVIKFMKPVISSKIHGLEEVICELVSEACINVCPENTYNFNVDNVRVAKVTGSSIHDSYVINGMLLLRNVESHIKSVENCKVAVFSCPIEVPNAECKTTVVMHDDNDLLNFSKGEEKEMEDLIKSLYDENIRCLIVNGTISDLAMHYLNN